MKNILKSYFSNKSGMTLVEVLTAMAILSLIVFCFTPLFLTYFDSIKIAGDEIKDVQSQSGILQTVIGNYALGEKGEYQSTVGNVKIELSTPTDKSVTLTRKVEGEADKIVTLPQGAATVGVGNGLDNFKGDFLVSDPTNLRNGYTTIVAQGQSSGLTCYPKTLTDDFIEAQIVLCATGFTISDLSKFTLSCGQGGTIPLARGTDYAMEVIEGTGNYMVELTLYGGGPISFENSPLIISYNGGQHTLKVEIDAPSMIMVGEGVKEGNETKYYYYATRGARDTDNDGKEDELSIIRREMNSVDAHDITGNTKTQLTSAMNDVEWVPADSADEYGKYTASNGTTKVPYGYYVMCGDNGQVRRFWREDDKLKADGTVEYGNYYWGGDYTYYTDYNFDQFSSDRYINGTKTYSTDTSFKFVSQRSMSSTQSGFNVSTREFKDSTTGLINVGTGLLRSLSVVSVTSAETGEFYGNDGKIWFYKVKMDESKRGEVPLATLAEIDKFPYESKDWKGTYNAYTDFHGYDAFRVNSISDTAHGWFKLNGDSYYEVNGITDVTGTERDSHPITLTSVDAIKITNPNKTNVREDGSYYFTTQGDGDTSAEGADTNLNYPQSSYTLYCGYIPAFMDLFATVTGRATYKYPTAWKGTYAHTEIDDGTPDARFSVLSNNANLPRADNRTTLQDNANHYAFWRMTLGLTPYYNNGAEKAETGAGQLAFYDGENNGVIKKRWTNLVVHYPYTNVEYAITGKFYDLDTYQNNFNKVQQAFGNGSARASAYTLADPNMLINTYQGVQTNVTNGEIVDITISYLSHPFAIAVAANPTDDVVYDLDNNKSGNNQVFYWNNRRETITFLDAASTVVPNGENDIPVSLMVGYVLGGTVDFAGNENVESVSDVTVTVGSVMNNGIVFLRAGDYWNDKHNSANSQTYEYRATDNGGYKLDKESNVFHQFYYLNSRAILEEEADDHKDAEGNWKPSGAHDEYSHEPKKEKNIGNLYGANYWQNNRHIQQKSIMGGTASNGNDGSYEYLRSHPMSNTKVTCVAWGATWKGFPEAMWGTENGSVLSWDVDLTKAKSEKDYFWNDRSVDAEFQSYKWVDAVNGKTYAVGGSEGHADSVGSAVWGNKEKNSDGTSYDLGSGKVPDTFKYFCDKASQQTNAWSSIGFISTLETINDIAFANDTWVAVGDQSDKDPADYCSSSEYDGGGEVAKAYSDNGKDGSWVNVRYWVNIEGENAKQSDTNEYYHWRAVKISDNENYNIVQINNLDGLWVATGYRDGYIDGKLAVDDNGNPLYNNDEYDEGEDVVVCWTRDPLKSCTEDGGWSENTQFYAYNGQGTVPISSNLVGGINSCATRTE